MKSRRPTDRRCLGLSSLALVWFAILVLPFGVAGQYSTEQFSQIRGRSIGPAGMSGRVASVDVVTSNLRGELLSFSQRLQETGCSPFADLRLLRTGGSGY